GSVALVYDAAIVGATSPIAGERYRLEVGPTVGSLAFTGILADYRRYFMPVSFYTIAGRILHYGRYGSDGEDPRLIPLFIGYPNLVRGYDIGSLSASECAADFSGRCPALDRLLGSRILVANLEFRFPLLRPFGLRRGMYGPVPIEAAAFADGGVAWTSGSKPTFLDGDRNPVTSAGFAFRVNVLGFALAQLAFVRPFERPDKGWVVQFSFAPAF
ncbi:MAG: BamA/TamA family outer membrane protein, partial [bacterium]